MKMFGSLPAMLLLVTTAAAQQVRWWTGGDASHPTVYIGGEVLVEPTVGELEWALSRAGVL